LYHKFVFSIPLAVAIVLLGIYVSLYSTQLFFYNAVNTFLLN